MGAYGLNTEDLTIRTVQNPYISNKPYEVKYNKSTSTLNSKTNKFYRLTNTNRSKIILPMTQPIPEKEPGRHRYIQKSIKAINNPPKNIKVNIPHGDQISELKDENHTRIVFNNMNGMKSNTSQSRFGKLYEIGESAIDTDTDIMGFAETCVNFSMTNEVINPIQAILRQYWNHTKLTTSIAADPASNTSYQRGGTATIVTGNTVGRIETMASDNELGRWSCVTLAGKEGRKLTIITAYQVCKDSPSSADTGGAYMQQYRILNKKNTGKKAVDPRKKFWKDCTAVLQKYIKLNHEVLLMMDSNDPDRSAVNNMIAKVKMDDVHISKHGTSNEPETCNKGTKRIDFFFGTAKVIEATRKCGWGAYDEFCDSDHRHGFVDLDLKWLLGGNPPTMSIAANRVLKTSSPRHMKKYCEVLEKIIDNNNLVEKHDNLFDEIKSAGIITAEQSDELNKLDKQLTKAKLEAERQCSKLSRTPWSPAIVSARRTVRFWTL